MSMTKQWQVKQAKIRLLKLGVVADPETKGTVERGEVAERLASIAVDLGSQYTDR